MITVALVFGFFGVAFAAGSGMQRAGGTGRPDNGQVLRVIVRLNGKLMRDVSVSVAAADGSAPTTRVTAKNGNCVVSLAAGTYTVSASASGASATSPVTIVQSTDPAIVTLNLAPTN